MTNIDHLTNELSENEIATVSGGMMNMIDLRDSGGVGAWGVGGPAGFLIYQGGLGLGDAIMGAIHGRGKK